MDKYKVYNETKNQWEFVIADVVPTQCPDNPSDTMRVDSQVIVEENVLTNPDNIGTEVSLTNYKALKNNAIDQRTGELIDQGHEYPPASGKMFSMSHNAQLNTVGLNMSKDELSYPIDYLTKDGLDKVSLVDATAVHNFYLNLLGTKKAHLDSGNALRDQVAAAVDEASVDAIIDNR